MVWRFFLAVLVLWVCGCSTTNNYYDEEDDDMQRLKNFGNTQQIGPGAKTLIVNSVEEEGGVVNGEKMIYLMVTARSPAGLQLNGLTFTNGPTVEVWLAGDLVLGSGQISEEYIFDIPLNKLIAFPVVAETVRLSIYPFQGFNNTPNLANKTVAAAATASFSNPQIFQGAFDGGAIVTAQSMITDGQTSKQATPLTRTYKAQYLGGVAGNMQAPIAIGAKKVMMYGAADAPAANFWGFLSEPAYSQLDKLPLNTAPVEVPPGTDALIFNGDATARTIQIVQFLGI